MITAVITGTTESLLAQSDCVLSLEPQDLYGTLNKMTDQIERKTGLKIKPGTKVKKEQPGGRPGK